MAAFAAGGGVGGGCFNALKEIRIFVDRMLSLSHRENCTSDTLDMENPEKEGLEPVEIVARLCQRPK